MFAVSSNTCWLLATSLLDQPGVLQWMSTKREALFNHDLKPLIFSCIYKFQAGFNNWEQYPNLFKEQPRPSRQWSWPLIYCALSKSACARLADICISFLSLSLVWVALSGPEVLFVLVVSTRRNNMNRCLHWAIKNKPTMWSGQSQLALGWRII